MMRKKWNPCTHNDAVLAYLHIRSHHGGIDDGALPYHHVVADVQGEEGYPAHIINYLSPIIYNY